MDIYDSSANTEMIQKPWNTYMGSGYKYISAAYVCRGEAQPP